MRLNQNGVPTKSQLHFGKANTHIYLFYASIHTILYIMTTLGTVLGCF